MKSFNSNRDLLLLATLIVMVRAAWNLPSKRPFAQPITASASIHETTPEQTVEKPFLVHELDQNVLAQIRDLQTQVDQAIKIIEPSSTQAAQLQSMKQRLIQLKWEYVYTSPAIALLGPIGYTGIVIKEHRIEKGILKIINTLNSILHTRQEKEYVPVKTIAQGLTIAHTILAQLNNTEITGPKSETVY